MRTIKKKFLSFSSSFSAICLLTGIVFCVPLITTAQEVEELKGLTSIPQYVSYILNTIMLSAGALSVLVIVLGGLYWLVSLGRSKITSEGKEWVKAGILGLVLISCSYLIIMTINPKILSFAKLSFLPIPVPFINIANPTITGSVPTISFDEIPIGTLTENLVARSINCYNFDGNGEPIDGDPLTVPIWEPTFMNHDRIDCILKLAEAVEAKSKISTSLSKKITEVMNRCSCGGGGGDCKVGRNANCSYPGNKLQGGFICLPSTCTSNLDTIPCTGKDCCSPADKQEMEHGPITLDNNGCGGSSQTCQLDCEKSYKIRTGQDCQKTCKDACAATCEKSYKFAGLDEFRSQVADSDIITKVEKEITDKKIKVINKDIWEKLRLIDKLKYLKEKIKEINVDQDLAVLKSAKTKLNTCYFVSSAVKFLVDSANANKNDVNITTNNTFIDQVTKKPVDSSKYCEGFGYSNSSCFYSCQNTCNPISPEGQNCFKSCTKCANNDLKCLKTQKECLESCVNNQSCIAGSGFISFNKTTTDVKNPKKTIEDPKSCISSCRASCSDDCDIKYPNCPDALLRCKGDCAENSNSLIENSDRTYLATDGLITYANSFSDFVQFERSAKFALQGEYCSSQNPGDPDVFNPLPNNGDYSSLYFYNHPEKQKCPDCTQTIDKNGKVTISGIQQYQECLKGPSCSYAPKAPCVDDACTSIDQNLLNCSSTCEKFSYSGDPLTFYCAKDKDIPATDWVKEKWKLYDAMTCQKSTEVPVGQTVDGAIAWGEKIGKATSDFLQKTNDMVQYIKNIANEVSPGKNYCNCDSPCGDGKYACSGTCNLFQSPALDKNGKQTGVNCSCAPSTNCGGSPCQKIIGLLLGKKIDDNCPKGTEYKGMEDYANKISEALTSLKTLPLNLDKSEVLKRLNFSREKMDENSTKIKITPDKTLSIFNCYQVQNNYYPTIVSGNVVIGNKKIPGYCYGEKVSAYLQPSNLLLDNWFSCEKQSQEK